MRTLKFIVSKQKISPDQKCDFSGIVKGTKGYLFAEFQFDHTWNGLLKVAEFRHYNKSECYPVKIINNRCEIPSEVLKESFWCVNVVGKNQDTKIVTGQCYVRQEG